MHVHVEKVSGIAPFTPPASLGLQANPVPEIDLAVPRLVDVTHVLQTPSERLTARHFVSRPLQVGSVQRFDSYAQVGVECAARVLV